MTSFTTRWRIVGAIGTSRARSPISTRSAPVENRLDHGVARCVVVSRIASNSLGARVAHLELEEEAVELRFGQRIGAFHFDRILRGEHEERPVERARLAADGDAALLHRFEQRGLRLRRGAVDFVGEQQVAEDRPRLELEARMAVPVVDRRSSCR